MNWNLKTTTIPKSTDELIKLLLANREINDASAFVHPQDPTGLTFKDVGINSSHIKKAVKRLEQARIKKEKIIIFGDYDCDGVCATTVLWETLHELGFSVFPFIPNREIHGYGLSTKAIDELLTNGKPAIVISVDNGIVAHAQWQRLKDEGIFTILTDHHEPDNTKPPVDVLIHTTKLCGTTVAWMLARELDRQKAEAMLDLCAIATIGDQVPLTGANRSFVAYGLAQLNRTKRLGLKLLIEAAGLERGSIGTYGVSFGIVPRINAMGRLGSALDALRALCTKNETRARTLVSTLHTTNVERQDLTGTFIELARSKASDWEYEHIIVIADSSFHEGVIGLIASKLTEEFHKPSIVISIGEETSKASGRSVPGVHITQLLRSVQEDLLEVGGHPMAAGLRLETNAIARFKLHIETVARQTISSDLLIPHIDVDCKLASNLLTFETVAALKTLEPFGAGNREPIFLFEQMTITDARTIGKEGKHLKLSVQPKSDTPHLLEAIGFGMGEIAKQFPIGSEITCVGKLQMNEWKGRSSLQLMLSDLILSS